MFVSRFPTNLSLILNLNIPIIQGSISPAVSVKFVQASFFKSSHGQVKFQSNKFGPVNSQGQKFGQIKPQSRSSPEEGTLWAPHAGVLLFSVCVFFLWEPKYILFCAQTLHKETSHGTYIVFFTLAKVAIYSCSTFTALTTDMRNVKTFTQTTFWKAKFYPKNAWISTHAKSRQNIVNYEQV